MTTTSEQNKESHSIIPNGVKKETENLKTWKRTYVKDNELHTEEVDMSKMSDKHLNKAYLKCQSKCIELQNKINTWSEVMSNIEDIAQERSLDLTVMDNTYIEFRLKEKKFKN